MRIPDMEWSPTANFADTALSAENHTTLSGAGVPAREASTEASAHHNLPFALHKPNQTPREGIITHLQYRATPFFGRRGATTKFPRNPDGAPQTDPSEPSSIPSLPCFPSFPSTPPPDPAPAMIDDTAAILYAMLQRATLTVSAHHLTEKTEAQGERYSMRATKISSALTAFLRIGRELRAWLRLRPEPAANPSPGFDDDLERPSTTKDGYAQFYDHQGNKLTLASLMHPFLNELDAAVEQLRKEGIKIPPPA